MSNVLVKKSHVWNGRLLARLRSRPLSLGQQMVLSGAVFVLLLFWLCLPRPLFTTPVSDVLLAADSSLLGARIAADGQWRFPEMRAVPPELERALITFEDKRFRWHPGVDPLALGRALWLNLTRGEVVSGGSTLTMQTVRLMRPGAPRTVGEKIVEAVLALRLELSYSKEEILRLYLSHAPFGGNTVGAETAAWRYYGRPLGSLSWAEYATLAVLPNAPALIHPGRNRDALRAKRDDLLRRLCREGAFDEISLEAAMAEPLPDRPQPLPRLAPHLLDRLTAAGRHGFIRTTIDPALQRSLLEIADRYAANYRANYLSNLAILVGDVRSNRILAYIGNPTDDDPAASGRQVDMITAERSTGSLLKPMLYAAMLDDGRLLPHQLVPDIPFYHKGFAPQNYNRRFRGVVAADEALTRSLNVPMVRLLKQYDYARFTRLLQACGMSTLRYGADHYGLSLILGGAECRLDNITSLYASLARILQPDSIRYTPIAELTPLADAPLPANRPEGYRPPLSQGALWHTVEAMAALNRPEEEADWESFAGMKRVAWKTGTSYGARDAWAVGFTPRYAVGVWVGNATGEGRAGLSGVGYAAPILFDAFSLLPQSGWFAEPMSDEAEVAVCRRSGFRAGPYCDDADTLLVPAAGWEAPRCPYHRSVWLDATGRYRVEPGCYPRSMAQKVNLFVLPASEAYFYRQADATYEPLPPMLPGCGGEADPLDLIYPTQGAIIYLPKGFRADREKAVFRAAHARADATIFWHLDEEYLGQTTFVHELAPELTPGAHTLTLVDDAGTTKKVRFRVENSAEDLK